MSSAGFACWEHDGHLRKVSIVGGVGFGWDKAGKRVGDCLRRFKEPIAGVFLPDGQVHALKGHSNSNPWTASAACAGASLLAKLKKYSVIVTEGQSDVVSVLEVSTTDYGCGHEELRAIPLEHRAELFAPKEEVAPLAPALEEKPAEQ